MIKRLLLALVIFSLVILYIVFYQTNLIAEPTYTISNQMEVFIDTIERSFLYKPMVEDDKVFLELDLLTHELDLDIIWDGNNKTAIMYDGEKIIRFYSESSEMSINGGDIQKDSFLIVRNGQPYIDIDFINENSQYECKYIKGTNKLIVDKKGLILKEAQVINDLRVRSEKSIWSKVKDIVKIGDTVYIYRQDEQWSFVRTSKGFFGYLNNEDVVFGEEIEYQSKVVENIRSYDKKINLTWEYVYRITPSIDKLETVEGLDIISPTWFSLIDEEGKFQDKASKEYVEWAHGNGYEVWGLYDNSFDPDLTSVIVNDSRLREQTIHNIIELASKYRLDGINIDFENVYLKDRDMLSQFIKELSAMTQESDLILSMDITIKSTNPNWSLCYDRKELGKYVDYVALMAYDEYWAGRGVSGSVASIPWVESGISTLLDDVPKEKILLGIPFYTRIWKEEMVDNKLKATPYAVSMSRAKELITENNGIVVWDVNTKQNYGEYIKDQAVYKVWLENEFSIKERLHLINKYDLAGVASWRRGFEEKEIWNIISKSLK